MGLTRVEERAGEDANHYLANEGKWYEPVQCYILALVLVTSGPGEITLSLPSLKWLSPY